MGILSSTEYIYEPLQKMPVMLTAKGCEQFPVSMAVGWGQVTLKSARPNMAAVTVMTELLGHVTWSHSFDSHCNVW